MKKSRSGETEINVKHNWYIEVQGQLHITGRLKIHLSIVINSDLSYLERKFAYMVIWLGTEFTIKTVAVDHTFWEHYMKEKLTFFFNECMLKELANRRKSRKMKLREYNPQLKTFT